MGKITEPPDIERIFDKPGRDWTPEDRDSVHRWLGEKVWLYEDQQPGYLLLFAVHHLGPGTTEQDAEDTWGKFVLHRLNAVIDNYDPTKSRFWGYLLLSFKRYCWCVGDLIRKKRKRMISLDKVIEDDEGERPVLVLVDEDPNAEPEKAAERAAFLEALNGCLERLENPRHLEVFVLRDKEGLSEKETAEALGVPQGSVKGWLSRARSQLRECLQEKGWTP